MKKRWKPRFNTGSSYVAFVASKSKAGKVLDYLKERGLDAGER